MIDCLSAAYVNVTTILEFNSETGNIVLQDILNDMLPNLLPFMLVMGIYLFIINRGPKYIRNVIFIMILAVIQHSLEYCKEI